MVLKAINGRGFPAKIPHPFIQKSRPPFSAPWHALPGWKFCKDLLWHSQHQTWICRYKCQHKEIHMTWLCPHIRCYTCINQWKCKIIHRIKVESLVCAKLPPFLAQKKMLWRSVCASICIHMHTHACCMVPNWGHARCKCTLKIQPSCNTSWYNQLAYRLKCLIEDLQGPTIAVFCAR